MYVRGYLQGSENGRVDTIASYISYIILSGAPKPFIHINFYRKDLHVVKFINLIICIEIAENNYPPDHDLNW